MTIVDTLKIQMQSHKTQVAVVGIVSLAAGAFGGYTVAVKKLESKYSDISEMEIGEAKRFYKQLNEATLRKPSTPGEVLAERHPESLMDGAVHALAEYSAESSDDQITIIREEVTIKTNLFEELGRNEDDFDFQAELLRRDTSRPYLITEEEWQAGDPGYDQVTLSYYAGDNVLADEQEQPIDNVEMVIGEPNLGRFGVGNDDPSGNTMFIRNDKLKSDFEVVRSDGKYVHEVLGLEHSSDDRRPGVRKFRNQDL